MFKSVTLLCLSGAFALAAVALLVTLTYPDVDTEWGHIALAMAVVHLELGAVFALVEWRPWNHRRRRAPADPSRRDEDGLSRTERTRH